MEAPNFIIEKIKIKHLFGYKQIEWNLLKGVNILGGVNGDGKSTILKMVNALLTTTSLSYEFARLTNYVHISFTNGYSVYWTKKEQSDAFTANAIVAADKTKRNYSTIISNNDSSVQTISILNDKGEIVTLEEWESFGVKCSFINTFEHKIIPEGVSENLGNKDIRTNLDFLLYNSVNKRNQLLIELMSSTTYEAVRVNEIQRIIQKSASFKNIINPFFEVTDKSLSDMSSLSFQSKGGLVKYTQLSTGEKQLLIILLTAINTMERPGIMIMDEPDLGMHVRWKEELIKALVRINPNLQLIVSTHAPSMIKGWFDNVQEMSEITMKD